MYAAKQVTVRAWVCCKLCWQLSVRAWCHHTNFLLLSQQWQDGPATVWRWAALWMILLSDPWPMCMPGPVLYKVCRCTGSLAVWKSQSAPCCAPHMPRCITFCSHAQLAVSSTDSLVPYAGDVWCTCSEQHHMQSKLRARCAGACAHVIGLCLLLKTHFASHCGSAIHWISGDLMSTLHLADVLSVGATTIAPRLPTVGVMHGYMAAALQQQSSR